MYTLGRARQCDWDMRIRCTPAWHNRGEEKVRAMFGTIRPCSRRRRRLREIRIQCSDLIAIHLAYRQTRSRAANACALKDRRSPSPLAMRIYAIKKQIKPFQAGDGRALRSDFGNWADIGTQIMKYPNYIRERFYFASFDIKNESC